MNPGLRRLLLALVALALVATPVGMAGLAQAASPTTPIQLTPSSTPTASPTGNAIPTSPQVTANPAYGAVGTSVTVTGAGWPAGSPVQVSLCGNLALNGTSDCDAPGAASATTNRIGEFFLTLVVGRPPKPCPCVLYTNSFASLKTLTIPFNLAGAPNATPTVTALPTRSVKASINLSGTNLASWFGGPAKRTMTLSVTNTGQSTLTNPPVTLTVGRGTDPTTLLKQAQIGTIQPGATVEYSLPLTFSAPAFGEYRVKATFTGLDKQTTTTGSTSSYPWALIILAWLLLQPLLLGLYKRRPVLESGSDDPFDSSGPRLDDPYPVGPGAVGLLDDPFYAGVPLVVGAAVGEHAYGDYATAAPVGMSTAVVPQPTRALVPGYAPVFGVRDLRLHLDPTAATSAPPTVAPRIVLGGIVPRSDDPGY